MTTSLTFTPTRPTTLSRMVRLYGTVGLATAALLAVTLTAANSGATYDVRETKRIEIVPPVVPGIEAAPSAERYYERQPGPRFPSAGVISYYGEAPPNACGPGMFELVTRSINNEPRCIGSRH